MDWLKLLIQIPELARIVKHMGPGATKDLAPIMAMMQAAAITLIGPAREAAAHGTLSRTEIRALFAGAADPFADLIQSHFPGLYGGK
jgi:hypothetical protein